MTLLMANVIRVTRMLNVSPGYDNNTPTSLNFGFAGPWTFNKDPPKTMAQFCRAASEQRARDQPRSEIGEDDGSRCSCWRTVFFSMHIEWLDKVPGR